MSYKLKKLLLNWRIMLLILIVIISLVVINPGFGVKGVAIRSIEPNSTASQAGMVAPKPSVLPRSREVITEINGETIYSVWDYGRIVSGLEAESLVTIKTNRGSYSLLAPQGDASDIGLSVYNAPTTNIRKGLDLQGGSRVLLQPRERLREDEVGTLIDVMNERLNIYGLSDIVIREAGDLSGNQYIIVEIAGATEEEIRELLAQQGKFEARFRNETVFKGGDDVTFVCRSPDCSGIDPYAGCGRSPDGFSCQYSFAITLSQEAAEKQASATRDSSVAEGGDHLVDPLEFYLDGRLVNSLSVASSLRGQAATQVAISGPGFGGTEQSAAFDALQNMKRMQTILITGSLPVELDIIKSDSISPNLGSDFTSNAVLMGILAIIAVAVILVIRYRKWVIAIPIIVTMLAETLIMLGTASFIGWNIDLAAIAGILAAIGTGVDDQIVITDETLRGESGSGGHNWKQRTKRAFLIILLAYVTVVVAMVPLLFAGAGLLKGFAITTLIGVTVGVLVTRPAYAVFVEVFLK